MKKELLSPVGNLECLYQAVLNGADAIYLGGKKYGARAYADNFTEDELIASIHYCHLYGVKIYVTINTIIYEEELNDCLEYIRFLHENQVDAVILQDLGLIKLVRKKFPNLEIHASTQMHTHNIEQIKYLKELGVKRVVLARELSLEEINAFETDLEIEIFVHGALCVSYSGQCLFSSLLMDRSGNRGSCAGICRLPFKLFKEQERINTDGDFLLSTKELNTLDAFEEIMKSKAYSFKIEGRMKSPAYVGFITRLYRKLIDHYEKDGTCTITEEEIEELKVLYNRGFTKGFLFNVSNQEFMNIKTSNHQGISIGKVLEVTPKKIKIKLEKNLLQEDGIRFLEEDKGFIVNFLYDENGKLIHEGKKDQIVFVDNKVDLKKACTVLKTIDNKLMKNLSLLPDKKISISCEIEAYLNKPLKIIISDGTFTCTKVGSVIEKANQKETEEEVIKEKIDSLGNTPFILKELEIKKDKNIFIPMSELKNIRRELCDELIDMRENQIVHPFVEKEVTELGDYQFQKANQFNLNVLVRNEEQLLVCLKENVNAIYVTNEDLYQKYKEKGNIYLRLNRVKKRFKEYQKEKLLVGETGSLYKYSKFNEVRTDTFLNVVNSKYFKELDDLGAETISLSIENKLEDIRSLAKRVQDKDKIEVYLYGRPEVMIMKYCPLNLLVNKNKICTVCHEKDNYFLQDTSNRFYPIKSETNEGHLTHIFYHQELDDLSNLKEYQLMGISNYRIEFLDESPEEVRSILCKIKKCKI